MLARFWHWWMGQLATWLPRRVRSPRGEGAHVICLLIDEAEVVWLAEHGVGGAGGDRLGAWALLAHDGPPVPALPEQSTPPAVQPDTRVRLRFAASRALVRDVDLPSATEENLDDVVRFEMERLTPFRAQDVYHRYAVVGRDTAAGRIRLRLLVVPRASVDPVLALLGGARLGPSREEQQLGEDDDVLELEFRPQDYRPERPGRLIPALVVLNVALLLTLAGVVIAGQERILEGLDARMRVALASATRADALRQRLESLLGAGEFLLQQRRARPAAVLLLDDISAVLPDGTSLSRLEIRADEVQLHGVSTSASALIALIDESDLLFRARFASPVLRDAGSGRDRFHIAADVRSPQGAE